MGIVLRDDIDTSLLLQGGGGIEWEYQCYIVLFLTLYIFMIECLLVDVVYTNYPGTDVYTLWSYGAEEY